MTKCAECFFGGKTCGTKGDPKSPLVIVGESPGALEIHDGEPFVGPAGELLHTVLKEFADKLDVEPYYVNAFNCLPRKKDPKRIGKAAQACNGRLMEEIKAHPRKVILALGNAAVWSTTGNYGHRITQIRGSVFESELASEGIVATVHPSFILRGGGNLSQFKRDIVLALTLLSGEESEEKDLSEKLGDMAETAKPYIRVSKQYTPGKNRVLQTKEEVQEFCQKLKNMPGEIIGADFETDGFNPYLDERFIDPPKFFHKGILCGGFSYCDDYSIVIPGKLLTDEIFQNDCLFGWHNGKFDLGWARGWGLPSCRVDEDSMLLSYALNEQGGMHDLEQVGKDWLNAPNYKNMLEKHLESKKHSYATIPKDVLYEYQGLDAGLTRALIKTIRPSVNSDKRLRRLYEEILIPVTEHLHNLERNGFMVDPEQLHHNAGILDTICNELDHKLQDISREVADGDEVFGGKKKTDTCNIRSSQQVGYLLYNLLKLGNPGMSTDAPTLERLKDHPAVLTIRKYRKVQKLYSTYVKPAIERSKVDGRVHTTFKIHGTATGRLSSNQPNIQNVPRNPAVRGQFVAPKGRVLLECDLSQAELRMLAQHSCDQNLCSIFWNEEQSLHDEVATGMFGKDFTKDEKVAAKCVNFGIVYGITASGLANRVSYFTGKSVSMGEAQGWINAWAERFPDAWDFIQACREAVTQRKTLISAFGRKRRFNVVSRELLHSLQNEAANFPHQSGASDITLLAGMQLRENIQKEFDALMVNTVHDCLVNELPDDMEVVAACARKVISVMEDVPKQWGLTQVPFKAEAEVGYRWGNCEEFDPKNECFIKMGEKHEDKTIANTFKLSREIASGVLAAVEAME